MHKIFKRISVILFFGHLTLNITGQTHNCVFVKIDDRSFRINSIDDAVAKRIEIIKAIWGTENLPDRYNVVVTKNITSPLAPARIIKRVDRIEIPVEGIDSLKDLAYLFVPAKRNKRLVLFCPGHTCTLSDPGYGTEKAVFGLLETGFDVLAVFMPHITEQNCDLDHCKIFFSDLGLKNPPVTFGLRLFLEPSIVGMNYLLRQGKYKDISMVGLSGGGWTANILAAVDGRIKTSYSVAGSIPIYYRSGGSIGDIEQFVPQLYRDIAGYPDIYLLDVIGEGRRLTQIYNRYDDCCFGEKQHDPAGDYIPDLNSFEKVMKNKLESLGLEKRYFQYIDEVAYNHRISEYALHYIIIPGLKQAYTGFPAWIQ